MQSLTPFSVRAILILESASATRLLARYFSLPISMAAAAAAASSSVSVSTSSTYSTSSASSASDAPFLDPTNNRSKNASVPSAASSSSSSSSSADGNLAIRKDQLSFERRLWEKTRRTPTTEISLFENFIVFQRNVADVTFYLVANLEENEAMLSSALNALIESIDIVLGKQQVEKRSLISYYDMLALAVDEWIEEGIILEIDATTIASRVSKRPSDLTDLATGDPSSLSGALSKAKEQFLSGVLLK